MLAAEAISYRLGSSSQVKIACQDNFVLHSEDRIILATIKEVTLLPPIPPTFANNTTEQTRRQRNVIENVGFRLQLPILHARLTKAKCFKCLQVSRAKKQQLKEEEEAANSKGLYSGLKTKKKQKKNILPSNPCKLTSSLLAVTTHKMTSYCRVLRIALQSSGYG